MPTESVCHCSSTKSGAEQTQIRNLKINSIKSLKAFKKTDQDLVERVTVLVPGDFSFVMHLFMDVELEMTER